MRNSIRVRSVPPKNIFCSTRFSKLILSTVIISLSGIALLAHGCRPSNDLVRVNGKGISKPEFEERSRLSMVESSRQQKAFLVRTLVDDELLAQEAYRLGLDRDPKIRARIQSEMRKVYAQALIDSVLSEELSDTGLRAYYDAHTGEFTRTKIAISHILIAANPTARSIPDKAALRKRAETIKKIISKGGDFKKVASEQSDDESTRKQGGYLGWIGEDHPLFSLARNARSWPPGRVGGPFESSRGYHIVRLEQSPKEFQATFEQVKDSLRYKRQHELKTSLIERLRADAKIEILDPSISSLLSEPFLANEMARPVTIPPEPSQAGRNKP